MSPRMMSAFAIGLMAFASGAFANTETERQCFAPSEACAAPANDGVLLLAQSCAVPEYYHACASVCDKRYDICLIGNPTPIACVVGSYVQCINACLDTHC